MESNTLLNIKEKFIKYGLLKRTLPAILMALALAYALYTGGFIYVAFASIISIAVLIEWTLIVKNTSNTAISSRAKYKWYFFGFVYSSLAWIGLIIFRFFPLMSIPHNSFIHPLSFLWLIACTTDIGAYFAGILIGGPKIWKRASPTKTWSGFIGAILLSIVAVSSIVYITIPQIIVDNIKSDYLQGLLIPIIIVTLISITSQIGDLLESLLKRHFHVKDSSNLIPGHGGVMDRVDGIFGIIIVMIITIIIIFLGHLISSHYTTC